MAREFVRSIKNVKDINTINDNITEENDLISDINGNVYIRKKTGYQLLNVGNDKHINDLQNLIKKIDNVEYDFNGLKIDLNNYAKKSDIPEQLDLSPYAKKSDLTKYVKLIDLNGYAKKSELPNLTEYAKKTDIPSPPDLTEYAKKTDIPKPPDLTPYAKKTDIPKPPDLTPYAKKTELNKLITDTGWQNLTLLNNVQSYSNNAIPQYRIINFNGVIEISLRGAVKNITSFSTVIAKLSNMNLEQGQPFLQLTSQKKDNNENYLSKFARWIVKNNGNDLDIVVEGVNYDQSLLSANDWFPINTSFKM